MESCCRHIRKLRRGSLPSATLRSKEPSPTRSRKRASKLSFVPSSGSAGRSRRMELFRRTGATPTLAKSPTGVGSEARPNRPSLLAPPRRRPMSCHCDEGVSFPRQLCGPGRPLHELLHQIHWPPQTSLVQSVAKSFHKDVVRRRIENPSSKVQPRHEM